MMQPLVRLLFATIITATSLSFAPSGVPAQRSARPEIDRLFAEWDTAGTPGCALGVYQDGRMLYEHGYGMASLEHDVPITPETVFYVGSLSKQFTAMATALAIRQGRLNADDRVRRYLPELPEYADGITVRHLIRHTSGLRDYNTLLSIAGRRGDEAFDNLTVLRITAKQKKLNFEPGAEYLYSNTGYTLLALLVERAVGKPFAEFAHAEIFRPLGMTVTHFHTDESRLVKWRAFAYSPRSSDYGLDTPSNERAGAGGVFTNIRDLLRWDENFYDARVGGRALVDDLQVPGKLNDGSVMTYAWGLQIGRYRGMKIVEHSGSLGGYRAHLLRFPDAHLSVTALCNLGNITPGNLARGVADVVLSNKFTEARPSGRPAAAAGGDSQQRPDARQPSGSEPLSPAGYVGAYQSDEVDATFTITESNGTFLLRREYDREAAPLQQTAPDEFRFRGMTIRFVRDANRRIDALVIDAGRVRGIRFDRRPTSGASPFRP